MNARTRFPPVFMLNELGAVDVPQFIPGSPHNLPPSSERPAMRTGPQLLSDVEFNGPGHGLPAAQFPWFPNVVRVFDPHHYAMPTDGAQPVVLASNGGSLVLLQPATRRNYLVLRNVSAGAQVLFVQFGSNCSPTSALSLEPGEKIFLDPVPQGDMYVGSDIAGGIVAYSVSTIA